MNDGNAKHDLEQVANTISRNAQQSNKVLSRQFLKLFKSITFFLHKRFNSSMQTLMKDGPTKEIEATPPLTREEMKDIVAKAKEAGLTVGIREMTPDGDLRRRKSTHAQEKIAKHEIKAKRFKEISRYFSKIKPLSSFFYKLSTHHTNISLQDSLNHSDKRYIILANKSRVSFMNECLQKVQEKRTEKMKDNELEDINKDGIIDEKDIGTLKTRDIEMDPTEINQINEDYGDCLIAEYHENYSTQKVSKDEYCAMRKLLFDLSSHAAKSTVDGQMLIAVSNSDLQAYLKFAPASPIKEYGDKGGKKITAVSNDENLQHLVVSNEEEWQQVKNKYSGSDYIASHNPDGSISFLIREEDTKTILNQAQKKSTSDLLDEAEKVISQSSMSPNMDKVQDIAESLKDKSEDIMEVMDK